MAWTIEFDDRARKDLDKLDPSVAKRVAKFLVQRIGMLEDPRSLGEALHGDRFGDFWKYRVGDYRAICRLEDARLVVLVVQVGHRREVYR
jgi:mRNA interferase RelE/StbE